jgi:splicing factor 3B subunit 2
MPGAVTGGKKESKNQRRRALKKQQKQQVRLPRAKIGIATSILRDQKAAQSDTSARGDSEVPSEAHPEAAPEKSTLAVKDAPVASAQTNTTEEPLVERSRDGGAGTTFEVDIDSDLFQQYKTAFQRLSAQEDEAVTAKDTSKPERFYNDDDEYIPDEEEETLSKLSKKARKAQNKLSIAELKAIVTHPELVEWTDTSAPDPRLLVSIKGSRNVVPVPAHWSVKREYLSSKRGIEKPQFQLPKFIVDTGITEMRDAVLEKQEQMTLKQKQRERVQPKMGKLDIDYQKLYEAFFRLQTKPELTRYGEIYYEGKEFETNLKHLRPGELSDELKEALGMPPGAPPPWLINQQRYGPPPSYPGLKIPGLNAPPPPGGQWGYHPGGYGKPPVDEFNRPLYGGDIFGMGQTSQQPQHLGEPVEKTLWGELQAPEEESEEESEEEEEESGEEEEEEEADIAAGIQTPMDTASGIASQLPSDFPTDRSEEDFTLRKDRRTGTETEEPARSAYTVLPEHKIRTQGFFGGERAYDLRTGQNPNVPVLGQEERGRKRKAGDVDVSVDIDALARDDRLSKDEVRKQYETQKKSESRWQNGIDQDDLSAMIMEESNKRLKKDQERRSRR